MSEKVIYEIRMIETDDGIRIETKGDKERLHEFFEHRFEHRMHRHEERQERQEWRAWKRWERRFRRPWFFDFGFGPWWDDVPESPQKPDSPAADAV